jgi:hypothetical protein
VSGPGSRIPHFILDPRHFQGALDRISVPAADLFLSRLRSYSRSEQVYDARNISFRKGIKRYIISL